MADESTTKQDLETTLPGVGADTPIGAVVAEESIPQQHAQQHNDIDLSEIEAAVEAEMDRASLSIGGGDAVQTPTSPSADIPLLAVADDQVKNIDESSDDSEISAVDESAIGLSTPRSRSGSMASIVLGQKLEHGSATSGSLNRLSSMGALRMAGITRNSSSSQDMLAVTRRLEATNAAEQRQLRQHPRSNIFVRVLTQISFDWLSIQLIAWVFHKLKSIDDLWDLQSADKSRALADRFEKHFSDATSKRKAGNITLKVLIRMFGLRYALGWIFMFCADLCRFIVIVCLQFLLQRAGASDSRAWEGYVWAVAMFLAQSLASVFNQQSLDLTMTWLGTSARSTLMSAIYRKSMRLSNRARTRRTAGEIVNLMSSDCESLIDGPVQIILLCSKLLQLTVYTALLFWLLQLSAFVSMGALVILVPFQFTISIVYGILSGASKGLSDQRIKNITEVLSSIRLVKLFAWEQSYLKRILSIRQAEMTKMRLSSLLLIFVLGMSQFGPLIMSVATIGVLVLQARGATNSLFSSATVFPALTAIMAMRIPMNTLAAHLFSVIMFLKATQRINSLLTEEEDEFHPLPSTAAMPIQIIDGSFHWDNAQAKSEVEKEEEEKKLKKKKKKGKAKETEEAPASPASPATTEAAASADTGFQLKNINLQIPKGALVAIIGSVGSGKSSLLQALQGEMQQSGGQVKISGTRGVCTQQACILNDTVRGNILFGKPYDEEKYQTIIKICALEADFAILPNGDQTAIGEKGVTLSGGQKQRIALARCAYADPDVYLLDDPLSAVDAHVGKHLFTKCIAGELLKNKTRILVTHQIQYLQDCTHVIVMDKGNIVENGSYKELLAIPGGIMANLVKEHLAQADDDEEEEAERKAQSELMSQQSLGQLKKSPSEFGQGGWLAYMRSQKQQTTQQPKKSASASSITTTTSTASETSTKQDQTSKSTKKKDSTTGMSEEKRAEGRISFKVIADFINVLGGPVPVLFMLSLFMIAQLASNVTDWWLSAWLNSTFSSTLAWWQYLCIYVGFGLFALVAFLLRDIVYYLSMLSAANRLHNHMLLRIMCAPVSFFETTPLGRIISRFSGDTGNIDGTLALQLNLVLSQFFSILFPFIVLCLSLYWVLIPIAVLLPLCVVIASVAQNSAREIKRLETVSKSPIYALQNETMSSMLTIKTFGRHVQFLRKSEQLIDANNRCLTTHQAITRWTSARLEFIGCVIVLVAAILLNVLKAQHAGTATSLVDMGLGVTYASSTVSLLSSIVIQANSAETALNAVERVLEYTLQVPNEDVLPPKKNSSKKQKPPVNWPSQGAIEFVNVSARYRPELPLVLEKVSFQIKPGEKIGICGRTGSGKSTTISMLFRTMPIENGEICIDGIDISLIDLFELRSKLAIIPQEPVLISGTVRSNLDPFGEHSDAELWDALERAHMKSVVEQQSGDRGLEMRIEEGGQNLSVGQRQLLCLARALVRKSKILILDEASASLDVNTDLQLQKTVRECFSDCTRLTIAHRINTIIDSDRILVLDNGHVAEFDTPKALLSKSRGLFKALVDSTGEANASLLRKAVRGETNMNAVLECAVDCRKAKKFIRLLKNKLHHSNSMTTASSPQPAVIVTDN